MIAISDLNQRGDQPIKHNLRIVWKVIKYDRNYVMHANWRNPNTVTHRASKAMLADNNQCSLILWHGKHTNTYEMSGLRHSTRKSYRTHTPNTVTPVSFTSMAQVPNNRLRASDETDTVGGNSSAIRLADTLLKDKDDVKVNTYTLLA